MKNFSTLTTRTFWVLCLINSLLHLTYFFLIPALENNWPFIENLLGVLATLTFFTAVITFGLSALKRCPHPLANYLTSLYFLSSYYFLKILFNNVLSTLDFLEFLKVQNNLKLLVAGNSVFYSGAMLINLIQLGFLYYLYTKSKKEELPSTPPNLSRSFLIGGFHTFVLLIFIPTYLYFQFSYMFNCFAKGFIRIVGPEMMSVQKIYQKEGREIHLIPMVHIADKSFYSKLLEKHVEKHTLILSEGVSDKNKLITSDGSYNNIGKLLGLSSQKKELSIPESSKATQLRADIDVDTFSPTTISILNAAFKLSEELGEKETFMMNYVKLQGYMGNRKTLYNFFYEILEIRNKSLFKLFQENEQKFKKIVIPWGALHLPGIEKRLKSLGYKFISQKSKRVLDLWTIFGTIINKK